jgi:hypothetical protein
METTQHRYMLYEIAKVRCGVCRKDWTVKFSEISGSDIAVCPQCDDQSRLVKVDHLIKLWDDE